MAPSLPIRKILVLCGVLVIVALFCLAAFQTQDQIRKEAPLASRRSSSRQIGPVQILHTLKPTPSKSYTIDYDHEGNSSSSSPPLTTEKPNSDLLAAAQPSSPSLSSSTLATDTTAASFAPENSTLISIDAWIEKQVAFRFGKHYEAIVRGDWSTCTPVDLSIAFSINGTVPRDLGGCDFKRNRLAFEDFRFHDATKHFTSEHIFPIDMCDIRRRTDCAVTFNRAIDSGRNLILWPLYFEYKRFTRIVHDPIRWNEKKNVLMWRGSTTGLLEAPDPARPRVNRIEVVQRWFEKSPLINIGFSNIVQLNESYSAQVAPIHTGSLSWENQLKHKYILAMEGNDCPSNLPHILASNSVAFLTYPIQWHCIEHGLDLQPWVHFVPVALNGSDLLERVSHCIENDDACRAISLRAQQAIQPLTSARVFDGILERMALLWDLKKPRVT